MNTNELKSIIEEVLAGMNAGEAPAAEAPAEAPAAPAAEPSVANFTKEQIVEAVIRVLDAKGILDKILD